MSIFHLVLSSTILVFSPFSPMSAGVQAVLPSDLESSSLAPLLYFHTQDLPLITCSIPPHDMPIPSKSCFLCLIPHLPYLHCSSNSYNTDCVLSRHTRHLQQHPHFCYSILFSVTFFTVNVSASYVMTGLTIALHAFTYLLIILAFSCRTVLLMHLSSSSIPFVFF